MTILTYHRIINPESKFAKSNLCVSPENFERQILFLLNNDFKILSLNNYADKLKKSESLKKCVSITFDDGTTDLYDNAVPIIEKFKIPVVFFVSTNPFYNKPLKTKFEPEPNNYMTSAQIKDASNRGIIIASHGKSHSHLAKIPAGDAEKEIFDSKKILEEIISTKVEWFCYPYGSVNKNIISIVKNAGYKGACSVIRDNRNSLKYLFFLKRVMIMNDTSIKHFKYLFSNIYHIIHRIKNYNRWKDLKD